MFGLSHLAIGETFNSTLTMTILLIAISQFNYGFDQQGFNATQAMSAFSRQYGSYNPKTKKYSLDTVWLSMFTGLPLLGMAVGILVGSMISSRCGRRACMLSMNAWSLVATTIIITASSADQILAGRVLMYLYIGMQLSVRSYLPGRNHAEKGQRFYRRELSTIFGSCWLTYFYTAQIGGLVINGVARGTGSIDSSAAFRIPYGLFYIVPVIVICGIWFVPESPRWLCMKGRDTDALASLTRLRKGKFTPEEITREMAEIKSAIDHESSKAPSWICSEANGYQIVSVYGAIFVNSLGFINPFTFTIIGSVLQVVLVFVAILLMDKLGRRQLLFLGCTLQAAAQFAMGGLGMRLDRHPSSTSTKTGIVVALILTTAGFVLGWAPTGHVLSDELPSMKLRDVTYRTASVIQILTQFAVIFSLPYLLDAPYADLGSKVGFIYGSVTLLSLLFTYFCIPDCKGRTLEEIDVLFDSRHPVRHYAKVKLETPLEEINAKEDIGHVGDETGNKNYSRVAHIEDNGIKV